MSSLDIRKPFDRVNHYKMYMLLFAVGVSVIIVDVLCKWYSKLHFAVRWNSQISQYFAVNSGVRQGSCLSPAIFNVFMNAFITQLKSLGNGCFFLVYISRLYIVLLLCTSFL